MADPEYQINLALGRCVTVEACGYACYVGMTDARMFTGTHRGSVGTIEDAERWLQGDDTVPLIQVWPLEAYRG